MVLKQLREKCPGWYNHRIVAGETVRLHKPGSGGDLKGMLCTGLFLEDLQMW